MKRTSAPSPLTIRHATGDRESFGDYRYEIFRGGTRIARYAHDYRGDACWILFEDGRKEDAPGVRDFLTGGGPQPLGLSDEAVRFLTARLTPGLKRPAKR
ncbi:hypothetical protein JYK02_34800 [Corallococcus macrosporus]|uniref:Uncharacterized protein n=1 Tax=Corallococcus macrosporus TaxID=35 RepID=A0ABS3DN35_9BACT|nr:hypothetical protein [Corallococcus macrosporus]MBN8232700.1 hypothetical protein [Corallococcus macrosporus]